MPRLYGISATRCTTWCNGQPTLKTQPLPSLPTILSWLRDQQDEESIAQAMQYLRFQLCPVVYDQPTHLHSPCPHCQ